jgi:hypothetical protein
MSDVGDKHDAAAAKGLVVVEPLPHQIFVDLDDHASCATFWRQVALMAATGLVTGFVARRSPSRRPWRWHVCVYLTRDVRHVFERIMLQALLGSDRMREACSWMRAVDGDPMASVLFEQPSSPPWPDHV